MFEYIFLLKDYEIKVNNKENVEKEEMERLYNERNKSQILIDDEEEKDNKMDEKLAKDSNETSTRKIDTLLTKLRDVEKFKNRTSRSDVSDTTNSNPSENNKLAIRKKREERKYRNKIKREDTNYTSNKNEKDYDDANDMKPALLERAQTMLNNIQNI